MCKASIQHEALKFKNCLTYLCTFERFFALLVRLTITQTGRVQKVGGVLKFCNCRYVTAESSSFIGVNRKISKVRVVAFSTGKSCRQTVSSEYAQYTRKSTYWLKLKINKEKQSVIRKRYCYMVAMLLCLSFSAVKFFYFFSRYVSKSLSYK